MEAAEKAGAACSAPAAGYCGDSAAPESGVCSEIEVAAALGGADVFHIVKEVIGFALYMHHQIPTVLQSFEDEYSSLKDELRILTEAVVPPTELRADAVRRCNLRKRGLKKGIKNQEKLMKAISDLLSALKVALDEVGSMCDVTVIIGGSITRPLHVYNIKFSLASFGAGTAQGYTCSKIAQNLSKKVIRSLVSRGAGSISYTSPSKTFLLIRCPCTANLSREFLPKRNFRYSKKVVPFRLHIKSKMADSHLYDEHNMPNIDSSTCRLESTSDLIWFQCRHTLKGMACKASLEC